MFNVWEIKAVSDASAKFTRKWKGYLAYYEKVSHREVYKRNLIWPQGTLSERTLTTLTDNKGNSNEDGTKCVPETCPHCVILIGVMSEKPDFFTKIDEARFLQQAQENAAYDGRSKPGNFLCFNLGPEETWTVDKYLTTTRRDAANILQGKLLEFTRNRSSHSSLEAAIFSREH